MNRLVLALALALLPSLAFAQSLPSPTVNDLTVNGTLTAPVLNTMSAATAAAQATANSALPAINATQYGACTWDAAHDVAPCINAAIAYANTLPTGATIHVPTGNFLLASTVAVTKSSVSLEAQGHGGQLRDEVVATTKLYGTKFTWSGAAGGTMLVVSPPQNLVNGSALSGTNVKGILLDAASTAATCAKFASILNAWIDMACAEPTGAGVIFDTAAISSSANIQNNDIWLSVVNRTGTGPAVVWDATGNDVVGFANGNVSFNRFHSIRIIHKDGDGLVSNHSDNNIVDWMYAQLLPGGGGNAVVFNGSSNPNALTGSDSNFFVHYSANAPFLCKGTEAFTHPCGHNTILHLDTENATVEPTLGTAATTVWRRGDNIWSGGQGAYAMGFGPSAQMINRAYAANGSDPVRIFSSSNGGVLIGAITGGGADVSGHLYVDPSDQRLKFVAIANLVGIDMGGPNAPFRIGGIGEVTFSGSLTAHTGGGQTDALPLTVAINRITTVAAPGDSVRLPLGVAGRCVETVNDTANAMQVFGAGSETINGVATAVGVSVAPGKTGHWCAAATGTWFGGTLN